MSLEGTSLFLEGTPLPSPTVHISLEKRTNSTEPIQNSSSGLLNNSTDGCVSLPSESADVSSDPKKTSTFEEHASFQPVKMVSNIGVWPADISGPQEEISPKNDGLTSGGVEIPLTHPQMLRRYPFWSELGAIREEDEEEQ